MAARAIFKRSDYTAKAYKATAPKNVVCHKPLRYCVKMQFFSEKFLAKDNFTVKHFLGAV